ncbi:MAG: DUF4340 domain-containing protein [Pirellulales bacterium]|nr:DUF4340 domain-containing protein [Pirellulales bacterium]
MTEIHKTIALVAVSAVVFVAGIVTRPQPPKPPANSQVGEALFPKLAKDPLAANRMRIVTYDDAAGKAREFEVAQVNNIWSLPSHKNYPADAKDQMAAAATALVDVRVDGIASENPEDQALYGVVEPDPTKDQAGQKGLGKLVVLDDKSNKPLARIIIGKEYTTKGKDEFGSAASSKMRYVRIPGQNVIYRVALASDKFSSKFEDWIETDLLKLNAWDITNVDLRDYSVQEGIAPDGRIVSMLRQRANIDLGLKDSKWQLDKLVEFKDGKPVEEKLQDDQELNSTKLNELKTALDDLKIVNVERKPARMSANMKAGQEFMNDFEALSDLAERGFMPARVGDNEFDIKSKDGEAIVGMKDGVEYVLRFGDIAGVDSGSDEKSAEPDEAKASDAKSNDKQEESSNKKKQDDLNHSSDVLKVAEKKGATVNRYVMVMARFNADLLSKPQLEPVPEIKVAPEKKEAADKTDPATKDAAKTDAANSNAAKTDPAKPDSANPEASKSEAAEANAEKKPNESNAIDAQTDDAAKTDETKKAEAKNPEDDLEAQEAHREKIEKENKRKQDEYDDKVKKGEERVKELNGRFADWYYVISDATYRKIHLGIDDIIVKKPKEEKGNKADATTPPDSKNSDAKPAVNAAPAPAVK